ncbi:CheC, inhibitor of MCP methylation [Thermosyntropha lipolytica DSM 11003]|uniref:CheC, inhibitor of MCP methylation n=2 Tax=Thermosyntropha TaxID=54293 RepID=A0A1M5KZ65_9FIRM|nr:flagellar motor switch phosphatase FliY [Thermosyntropha lipolytica]SHG57970.1 CheC, inhibitor of MCP methylation [Thermosyntropha lipolytica DSM 11003]
MNNDGVLSQEEIDALLSGNLMQNNAQEDVKLSNFEKDALGEIGNITMGTAATTLSTLLRKRVSITTPHVMVTSREKLQSDYPLPYVVAEVRYTEGLSGTNILTIKQEDAAVIADLMMGGTGQVADHSLDELRLSAVGEAMNQMMGSATTSLSSMFNTRIDIAPPKLMIMDFGKENLELSADYEEIVAIKFKMEIEDLVDSEIIQIIPLEAARNMVNMLMGGTVEESSAAAVLEMEETAPKAVQEQVRDTVYSEPEPAAAAKSPPPPPPPPGQEVWSDPLYADIPSGVKRGGGVVVQPAQFAPLRESYTGQMPNNINLIMDVPLEVTVELGKTRKTIREVLELGQGSIIQLDKMAGEPVDLLVNGKLIAKGEVVVIDENYGIRITTIISPMDRMSKLQ